MTADPPNPDDAPDPDTVATAPEVEAEEEEPVVVIDPDRPKVIHWDDMQQELARLCSLTSAVKKANEHKDALAFRIKSLIEAREESIRRSNELEEIRQKLEERKLAVGNLLLRNKNAFKLWRNDREKLVYELRLLLLANKEITAGRQKLQEAVTSLLGERGHLQSLRRALQTRQQHMVAQVSAIYPVKASAIQSNLFPGEVKSKSGDPAVLSVADDAKPQSYSLTISGLQPTAFPLRKSAFFRDKKEAQKSAAALGYIAHAVSLVASYLDVPLRYPVLFGGSRSYMHDYAPATEPSPLTPRATATSMPKPIEFPLFLEGQDSTRAAYAVFLLSKDLEQTLNFIGAETLGPRHLLPNLRELFRIILSEDYLET